METPIHTRTSFHHYGGQLKKLRKALSDPFEQYTEIAFLGDSITWGTGLPGSASSAPNTRTLTTPRNNLANKCWVNEFKRYIGKHFFDNAAPLISNWHQSESGESTVEYQKAITLLPMEPPFEIAINGGGFCCDYVPNPESKYGYTFELTRHRQSPRGEFILHFHFYGKSFELNLISQSKAGCALNYDLYSNGDYLGNHTVDATETPRKLTKVHDLEKVANHQVSITVMASKCKGKNLRLTFEGVTFNKTVRIINQGICGATVDLYNRVGFTENGRTCLTPATGFVFVQLGTNDRIANVKRGQPVGLSTFQYNLHRLRENIGPSREQVYLCGPPAARNSTPVYFTNMANIRSILETFAIANNSDFIDNYTAFGDIDLKAVLLDGLHPNELGHFIIFNNVTRALEMAS